MPTGSACGVTRIETALRVLGVRVFRGLSHQQHIREEVAQDARFKYIRSLFSPSIALFQYEKTVYIRLDYTGKELIASENTEGAKFGITSRS